MFAGLPGIGLGTLFYVLLALWMPIRELPRLVTGKSSVAQWRLIGRQWFHALGVVATVMFAERLLLWILGATKITPFSPAAYLHSALGARAGDSLLAAPIAASLLLLAGLLLVVELLRLVVRRPQLAPTPQAQLGTAFHEDALDSSTTG